MGKVKMGFFAFTEVHALDRHVEYNWWHSSDHQPENMALDNVVHATRWAAPQALMDARGYCHPALKGHQYLVHYLFDSTAEKAVGDFSELGANTRALGRFFGPRTIVAADHYDLVKTYTAPGTIISAEALPFRPYRGVHVVVRDIFGAARYQEIAEWYDRVHIPDVLAIEGMLGCSWFKARSARALPNEAMGHPKDRHVWVYYLDDAPLAVSARIRETMPRLRKEGRVIDAGDAAEIILSGPYETIRDPRDYDWRTR